VENWSSSKKELGSKGEVVVRQWLINHGYMVLPASLINIGSAPMLLGKLKKIILPDTLTWKEGNAGWVEIKTKSAATFHRCPPRRWEHGIPERHWINYCVIQTETHTPVSLAILQIDQNSLFLGRLDSLKRNIRRFPMMGEVHVFFNLLDTNYVSDFDEWYHLDDKLPDPIQPLAIRTLEQSKMPFEKQTTLL
jgi:hypothetical protein